jgi:hypothetical protein
MSDKDQRVREIAYYLWEQEGWPESQADRHWATAVAIVEAQDAQRENSKSEEMTEDPGDAVFNKSTVSVALEKSSAPPAPPLAEAREGRRSAASR